MPPTVPIEGEVKQSDKDRFFAKTKRKKNGCLIWTGANQTVWDGAQYGCFRFNGRSVKAHRFALYIELGEDPGVSVDHLCHTTLCVEALHLRGGSVQENNRNRKPVLSEFCVNGHLRSKENIYIEPVTNRRKCRECQRTADRKRNSKRYEKQKALSTHTSERTAKLTQEQVDEIRSKYAEGNTSQRKLAREYQVSQPMIGFIVRREWWKTN
jgi:hypothetical protein